MTFCATVQTILHVGATPVLADVDEDGNLCPESVEKRITPRTRALVPVHLAGLPCQMRAIWQLARRYGLMVIEDAAHAVGAYYEGLPIGAGLPADDLFSDAVAYSFYATKNLTTGEGGMLTTHNDGLWETARILCLHGISRDAWNRYTEHGSWFYEVQQCGFKYNLSDIQSAIGLHQLRKIESLTEIRGQLAARYRERLGDVAELRLPSERPERRHAWHLFIVRLRLDLLNIDREQFIRELHARGVGASVHFIPVSLHPFYQQFSTLSADLCPAAMNLYPQTVSLPLYPAMSEDQLDHVTDSVTEIVKKNRRRAVFAVAGD
jgi:dTDP-4-amino-4,6-dideoxygalactose transaminase